MHLINRLQTWLSWFCDHKEGKKKDLQLHTKLSVQGQDDPRKDNQYVDPFNNVVKILLFNTAFNKYK